MDPGIHQNVNKAQLRTSTKLIEQLFLDYHDISMLLISIETRNLGIVNNRKFIRNIANSCCSRLIPHHLSYLLAKTHFRALKTFGGIESTFKQNASNAVK